MNGVLNILDEMDAYLEDCSSAFSLQGKKIKVDLLIIQEFMADLRSKLPEEVIESNRLLTNKDSILEETQRDVQAMREKVREEAEKLLNEHEIRRQAIEEAEIIKAKCNEEIEELKAHAYKYVSDLLNDTSKKLLATINQTNKLHVDFEDHLIRQVEILKANAEELKE